MKQVAKPQNPTQTVNQRIPKGKLGLIIVDLQPRFLPEMSYAHGNVDTGLRKVKELIKFAGELEITTTFLEYEPPKIKNVPLFWKTKKPEMAGTGRTFPSLKAAADNRSKTIVKQVLDGFMMPELRMLLKEYEIKGTIIAGYERIQCVRATVNGALRNGYTVLTSDELLFGDCRRNSLGLSRETMKFFRQNTVYFETVQELMETIREISRSYG
ncbi:MAG: isochorismatase family protein [Candidatus Micrarchaeota archaeon]